MPQKYISCCLILTLLVLAGCAGSTKKTVIKPVAPDPTLAKPVLKPEHEQAYQNAVVLLQSKSYSQAEASFKQLILNYPRLAGAYVNLGIIYEALEQIPDALEAYDKALEINPANVDALLQLGLLHIKRGRFGLAEQRLLEAEAVDLLQPLVQFNLGVLYELYLQDFDAAIGHYEKYVEISTDEDVSTVRRWIKLLERK